jgi:hypothetical protein
MKTSETILHISAALLSAQKTMGDAKKGSANPYFKSTYADLNTIREVCTPVLNQLGVVLLQPTITLDGNNYVETILIHAESGEFVSSQTAIKNSKGTAQDEGSGISYARRYSLQSLLNIGAVDDDGESTMDRKTEAKGETKTPSSFKKASVGVPASALGLASTNVTPVSKAATKTTIQTGAANGGDDW